MCGEIKAAPSEAEEIQFLCTVCAKLKADPYLVNFFIETPKKSRVASSTEASNPTTEAQPAVPEVTEGRPQFYLVESLLNLMHSPVSQSSINVYYI